jgi:hypothetical protein
MPSQSAGFLLRQGLDLGYYIKAKLPALSTAALYGLLSLINDFKLLCVDQLLGSADPCTVCNAMA